MQTFLKEKLNEWKQIGFYSISEEFDNKMSEITEIDIHAVVDIDYDDGQEHWSFNITAIYDSIERDEEVSEFLFENIDWEYFIEREYGAEMKDYEVSLNKCIDEPDFREFVSLIKKYLIIK